LILSIIYVPNTTQAITAALKLAFNNFNVVCFDSVLHGERNELQAQEFRNLSFFEEMKYVIQSNLKDFGKLLAHLKSDERVDDSRVGLVGISLGALSAFYSLSQSSEICAIVSMLGSPNFSGLEQYTSKAMDENGDSNIPTQVLFEIDPYRKLLKNEIRPMLLINGKNDDWIPSRFSESFYNQIKSRYEGSNLTIELFLSDEGHFVSNEMRERTVSWLQSNL